MAVGLMERKGQVSLFIIIGLVLIVIAGIVVLETAKNKASELGQKSSGVSSFSSDRDAIRAQYDGCMESVLLDGISEMFTLDSAEPALEQYIEDNFEACLALSAYSERGFDVTFNNFEATVGISYDSITLAVENDFS